MAYQVVIYCPDQHILYDPATPDIKGIGGGVIARIRLAQALARLGHRVSIISHVSRAVKHKGVDYLPLANATIAQTVDILILTSSGGALSLESARELNIQARLREIWLHGITRVQGVSSLQYDYAIGVSNFICNAVENEWGVSSARLISIYNGAAVLSTKWWHTHFPRDPYSLIYASHPSKGLDAAIKVLNILREKDERFKLHVFGGDALWGGMDKMISAPGVIYHGTQGQQNVFKYLQRSNISFHLQTIIEAFGMGATESMKHGCIPIASPLGAYSETIKHGYNGFLVPGDHQSSEVHQQTADIIAQLVRAPHYAEYIRHQAMQMPWTWDTQAKVWEQHWDWALEKKGETLHTPASHCRRCGGAWLLTADGYHCTTCSTYSRDGN